MQSKGTGMVERCRSSAALRCTHRRHAPSVAATADLRCREVDRSAHQHTLQVPEYTDRRDALASLFRSLSVFVRCARAHTHTHAHTHTYIHDAPGRGRRQVHGIHPVAFQPCFPVPLARQVCWHAPRALPWAVREAQEHVSGSPARPHCVR